MQCDEIMIEERWESYDKSRQKPVGAGYNSVIRTVGAIL